MANILCVFLSAFLIGVTGCLSNISQDTHPKTTEAKAIRGSEGALPQSFQLHDVPHNPRKQRGTDCAPDSLRMVLTYRGKRVGEQDITRQLTTRGRNGGTTLQQMQEIAVKSYDLPAFMIGNCDMYSLKAAIMNRWPPIVGYRASGQNYHAVVAVGYDDEKRIMFVHDPNFIRVRKVRYFDLGGMSEGSDQRLQCLLVLPAGSTEETLIKGLEKYVPKELSSKLNIYSMMPLQERQ